MSGSLAASHEAKLDMANVKRAYVNSLQDWKTLKERGLSDGVRVRTMSPWLARSPDLEAEAADVLLDHERVMNLFGIFNDISLEMYEIFSACNKGAALSAGHALWDAQRIAYHGALLQSEDFTEPICITSLGNVSSKLRGVLQFHWDVLLSGNLNAIVQNVTVDEDTLPYVAPPVANFWTRFSAARPADFAFRMMLLLGQCMNRSPGFETIYVRSESELLKDSSIALLRRRYWLRSLENPPSLCKPAKKLKTEGEFIGAIKNWIERILPERLDSHMPELALGPVSRAIAARVGGEVETYFDWRRRWEAAFACLRPEPAAIVSNGFIGAVNVGLGVTSKKLGIPLITFQHGASREIADKHDNNPLLYESILADLHLCFNDHHAQITRESPLTGGRCVKIGAPAFYRSQSSARQKSHKILYVSSGLYMGAQDKLHRAASDHATCEFETALVEECLAPSGEKILYKPYPALRYLDPDPAVEAARRSGNIEVMDDPKDLRYIVNYCSVLITSRSGSTVGYCLCQDIPLVYLQVPGRSLRENVEAAMRTGLFFFDARDSNFYSLLMNFLRLPLHRILEQWNEKSDARAVLIENYIDDGAAIGGERAAQAIDQLIRR